MDGRRRSVSKARQVGAWGDVRRKKREDLRGFLYSGVCALREASAALGWSDSENDTIPGDLMHEDPSVRQMRQ